MDASDQKHLLHLIVNGGWKDLLLVWKPSGVPQGGPPGPASFQSLGFSDLIRSCWSAFTLTLFPDSFLGRLWKGRSKQTAWRRHSQVPLVLACLDGLLGSPVPMVLLARTRNSYSTQGLRSITVAVSCRPPMASGTGKKKQNTMAW